MNKAIQTSKQLSGNTSRNLRVTSSQNQRIELYTKYSKKLTINPDLTRSIVSFQANKKIPLYRWIKNKETRYLFWFACLSILFALLNFQVSQIFFQEIPFL
jgi:hypothetical protein